jgi:hypothetical protein
MNPADCTSIAIETPRRLARRARNVKRWGRRALATLLLGAGVTFCPVVQAGTVLPEFNPANFVAGAPIDNPFYPLVPGTVRTYEADVKESPESETTHAINKVAVTSQTRNIGGVVARVVRDRTVEDGLLVEDTFDYFAQDKQGNVWYLGEDSTAFEYDDNGNITDTSTEGSWRTGVRGAKPGFIMPANPSVGMSYFQEFAQQDDALDQAKILSLSESATVPAGHFTDLIKTEETSTSEPGVVEDKFYARGIGELLTFEDINAAGEPLNVIPLVSVTTAAAVPLPPAAWAALVASALLLLPRAVCRLRRRSPA